MRLLYGILTLVVVVGGCSSSQAESRPMQSASEGPWSRAHYGAKDGWWVTWHTSLRGKPAPYGVGTRFHLETLGAYGIRQSRVIEVRGIKQTRDGFALELQSSDGSSLRSAIPPSLKYTFPSGQMGIISARNEKLVSVTVPAGTFKAGRLWTEERDRTHVEDEWVVAELPIPVLTWLRPVTAKEHYNPPADGSVPPGTELTRLVRIEKR